MTTESPLESSYDIVIIGGAIMGASTAWNLTEQGFDGRVLVVERDPTYEFASTTHTNSCMRQQFSTALNVQISQYAADFVNNIRERMGGDERVPELAVQSFGYMYLADSEGFADVLRRNVQVQNNAGAATQLMSAEEIKATYPFYNVDDVLLGSINRINEGYWDGNAVFQWWRRQSRERGVEYVENEVVAINHAGQRVVSVVLASGEVISCGQVVNATGPRAAKTAEMVGITLPIEPRKRFSWVFKADKPLDQDLPLTVDPSGVHFRENGGGTYQAGGHTELDPAAEFDDFNMEHSLWEEHIWPTIATRVPQFEAIKVISEWTGHYAMNTLDQNAIVGPHTEVENFHFINGFSGHGLQQSPAMGRGLAEYLTHGGYRSLDLSALGYERIALGKAYVEDAVI
ncbi:FAD-binding oxidoreductase [Lentibacter algarum]|uniref:NAD(P)/FAD-dependent oxidoreductase n=1 Tax=Lentibacter algarum TaxID=576131 RepID=UPI001C06A077|nr:FAD-binding oxidoreductase [Lentibacter algarum]MBU2980244.1 FAD-binding oxidoreductase [Lentibacter algarum]